MTGIVQTICRSVAQVHCKYTACSYPWAPFTYLFVQVHAIELPQQTTGHMDSPMYMSLLYMLMLLQVAELALLQSYHRQGPHASGAS